MDIQTLILAKKYADKQIEKAELGDIELDKTLTKEGFAADAKAVGDVIANLDIGGNIEQVQVDWEQNDSTQPDYIKNRPFGGTFTLIDTGNVCSFVHTFTAQDYISVDYIDIDLREKYRVIYNGTNYDVDNQSPYNYQLILGDSSFVNYPFYITASDEMAYWGVNLKSKSSEECTIEVYALEGDIKKIDPKYLPEVKEQEQADWDQNDSSQIDYIKNRPFYESVSLIMNSDVCGFTRTFTNRDNWFLPYSSVDTREKYRVTFDGISYDVENQSTYGLTLGDNGFMEYPFYVSATDDMDVWNITVRASDMDVEHTIQVAAIEGEIKKLDAKFLPDDFSGVEVDATLSIQGAAADAKAVGEAIASKEQLQADWNQTDITAADYIKNKPFSIEAIEVGYNEEIRWSDGELGMYEPYWEPSNFMIADHQDNFANYYTLFEFNNDSALVKLTHSGGEIEVGGAILKYSYASPGAIPHFFFNFVSKPIGVSRSYMKVTAVYINKMLKEFLDLPVPDWNQSDHGQSDYIKNRTHYDVGYSREELLGSYREEDEMGDSVDFSSVEVNIQIQKNYTYFIKTDSETYTVESFEEDDGMNSYNCIVFNNIKYTDIIDVIVLPEPTYRLEISKAKLLTPLKQLDEKFIPDTIARISDIPITEAEIEELIISLK